MLKHHFLSEIFQKYPMECTAPSPIVHHSYPIIVLPFLHDTTWNYIINLLFSLFIC